ncbi:MAG: hypothetical protein AAB654_09650 [Acidobacteriota bacterium]
MRTHGPQKHVAALACWLILGTLGCDGVAASDEGARRPVLFVVFVDQSLSLQPDREQLEHWAAAAEHRVFSRFRAGDALYIYGIHDQSGAAASLFSETPRALPPDADMDTTMAIRREVAAVLASGRSWLREALQSSVRSRQTRLLEALPRIRKDPERAREALFLSDMLESTPELDLERSRLTDQNMPELVAAAVARHRLEKDLLAGVSITCVLDSPRIGAPRRTNDRRTLECFWRMVLTGLGATLVSFDSDYR